MEGSECDSNTLLLGQILPEWFLRRTSIRQVPTGLQSGKLEVGRGIIMFDNFPGRNRPSRNSPSKNCSEEKCPEQSSVGGGCPGKLTKWHFGKLPVSRGVSTVSSTYAIFIACTLKITLTSPPWRIAFHPTMLFTPSYFVNTWKFSSTYRLCLSSRQHIIWSM